MKRAGASLVVSPYISAGHQITDALLHGNSAESCLESRDSPFEVSVVQLSEETAFIEKTVDEITDEFPEIVIVAIDSTRDGVVVRPKCDRRFEPGDQITLAGKIAELDRVQRAANLQVVDASNCVASRS